MATVTNRGTSPLGMPGPAVALGGVELAPGTSAVDDAVWTECQKNQTVQAWLAMGLLVDETPAPADAPSKASRKG